MYAPHAKGYLGEQTAGFLLGRKGYVILDGPSGAGGHDITTPGLDGAAYNPLTDDLLIYDNKSFRRGGTVGSASAITNNLANNLNALIKSLSLASATLPPEAVLIIRRITPRLHSAMRSVNGAGSWPRNCRLAVTAEAGNSTGVGARLSRKGIAFIDIERDL